MQLHSFAERAQGSYLQAVRQLAAYFNQSIHSCRFDDGFDLIICLKSQIARYVG